MIAEVNKLNFRPHDIREQMEAGICLCVLLRVYGDSGEN
jgi:hypothetical protein